MASIPSSPLLDLSNSRYGGRTYAAENVINVTTTLTRLLLNNANRVSAILINEGTYDVRFSSDPTITGSTGFLLPANGGVIKLEWDDDGQSVGYEYYGITPSNTSNVRVREVIRL